MTLLGKNGSLDWTHVPYKGVGPLMIDAVPGHVPMPIGAVFVTKPHIDSGRMRPLAVTSTQRIPDLPNVPTIAESSYRGFEPPAWWALLGLAKNPPDIFKRMNEALNSVLKDPEISKKLEAQGIDVVGGSADAARVFMDKQMDIWAKVVKDNAIRAD
jgi:tripartite-type tricarboxylate transporter receptor subunit TctC